jgi:hypothetical protein
MLSQDLNHLSIFDLKVIQLIPLSSIDVGLLFGIPIVVRAGIDDDYTQFQEMKIIFRSLFCVIQTQEQAIFLRGSSNNTEHMTTTGASGLFHSGFTYASEHYFVLMAQEIPITLLDNADHSVSPSSGLLFRIAHVDHLLHNKSILDSSYGQYNANKHEMEMQYLEFTESSLSTLNFDSFYLFFTFRFPEETKY